MAGRDKKTTSESQEQWLGIKLLPALLFFLTFPSYDQRDCTCIVFLFLFFLLFSKVHVLFKNHPAYSACPHLHIQCSFSSGSSIINCHSTGGGDSLVLSVPWLQYLHLMDSLKLHSAPAVLSTLTQAFFLQHARAKRRLGGERWRNIWRLTCNLLSQPALTE